tara:strand:- start:486 stop:1511 length:1026 start_codon:yes stop_codon:yes gene_type:complete
MSEEVWTNSRVRQLINQLVAFVAILDRNGILKGVDEQALETGGIKAGEVLGKPFWEAYWWSFDPAVAAKLKADIAAARNGKEARREEVVRIAGDQRMPIMLRVSPIFDEDGVICEIVVSAADISLQKDHERQLIAEREELALLNRELRHRVKNLFAIVLSAIRMSARQAQTPEDLLARSEGKIHALASAHLLATDANEDRVSGMREIFSEVLAGHGDPARFEIRGADPILHTDQISPIALIVHELATNSVKYGALGTGDGQIEISVAAGPCENGDDLAPYIHVRWREVDVVNGPDRDDTEAGGFGSLLIHRCAAQLNGEAAMAASGNDWIVSLRFPQQCRA